MKIENRKFHNVIQGSDEWHALRSTHFTASEAAAMMGVSKYQTRDELLKAKATGLSPDVTPAQQALFDRGHAAEASARPIAEGIIGDDLLPATVTAVVDGLPLLASCDGATMLNNKTWEHKLYNAELARIIAAGESLPEHYTIQMEQQLLLTGAEQCLFTTSDGTEELWEDFWYDSDLVLRQRIIAGWKQFEEDVANYKHIEAVPVAVAEAQTALPAVTIQVNGAIALIDNLDVFGDALQRYVADINQKPETDQDFANLEASVKTLKKAEDALLSAESGALAQTESIDTMRRKVANFHETARNARLLIERLVKAEKENRRNAILQGGKNKLAEHIAKLNARVNNYMPAIAADFVGAIKGKKTISSLQDAVNVTLAHAKIEANEKADLIEANLTLLKDKAVNHKFLFSDTRDLIMKATDDLAAVVSMRISEHEKAEAEKLAAEQARIRAEEQARAAAKIAAEEARIRAEEREKAELEQTRLDAQRRADQQDKELAAEDARIIAEAEQRGRDRVEQEKVSLANKKAVTDISHFEGWWSEIGSAIVPKHDDDIYEHARKVAQAAWTQALKS